MTDERMPPPGDAGAAGRARPEAGADDPQDTLRLAGARSATGPDDPDTDPRSLSERASTGSATGPDVDPRPSSETERPEGTDGPDPQPIAAQVEPPSPDIDIVPASSALPGSHRGGFFRLPTAPVAVTVQSAPTEPDGDLTPASAQWLASDVPQVHSGLAGWALAFAIVGLVVSLFVGWGFPIGLVAVVSAIFALRRPLESRAFAVWAIVIGALSILYSAGWLLYAASRADLFG